MAEILLDWLIEHYPTAKRQTLKRMVQAGRVEINGRESRDHQDADQGNRSDRG